MSFNIVIEDGVSIPKREIEFAPRGSQYPLDKMSQGQSFAIPVTGTEGAQTKEGVVLTQAEDAKRKASQKQSYFSSLGKKLGIHVVTRYFPDGEEGGDGTPTLRVWHNGERAADEQEPVTQEDEQNLAEDGEDLLGDE